VPRGWCLHGYRCGAEKKGTGGRWRQEGECASGSERKARTYLPTGVVDVLRIILVIGIREGTLGPSMISQMDSLAKRDDLCNDVREELISHAVRYCTHF